MKYGLAEIDWGYIGAILARGDDEQQATFFKAFCSEIRKYPTHHCQEMQLMAVRNRLTEQEREQLSVLSYEEQAVRQ